MRVKEMNEWSVLLARQSSALTFLLDKFKNTKRSFGYRLCQIESFGFQTPHCA
jgi:hypothetical protein